MLWESPCLPTAFSLIISRNHFGLYLHTGFVCLRLSGGPFNLDRLPQTFISSLLYHLLKLEFHWWKKKVTDNEFCLVKDNNYGKRLKMLPVCAHRPQTGSCHTCVCLPCCCQGRASSLDGDLHNYIEQTYIYSCGLTKEH